MTDRLKDYWHIGAALLVIFVAGNAFGFVLGKGRGSPQPRPPVAEVAQDGWSESTLDRLRESLALEPEQLESLRPAVERAAGKVRETRERALLDYHVLLLNLHDEIEPLLADEAQLAELRRSRATLVGEVQRRFSALLDAEIEDKLFR